MSNQPGYNPGQYWSNRDFHTSARLHLQHWLFQGTLGFVLNKPVTDKNQPLRIADLGCGNGAWLIEASHLVPPSTELLGFDIAPVNFPASAFLPSNVKLSVLDLLSGDLPTDLVGSFDIVNIRAFASIPKNNDPSAVITVVEKLLKHGGYFQWVESPPNRMTAIAPNESIESGSSQQLLQIIAAGGKMSGTVFDWLEDFSPHLTAFKDVEIKHIPIPKEHYKAWTENYLTVYEELAGHIPPAEIVGPKAPLSREIYQAIFQKVVEETNRGVALNTRDILLATGYKQ